MIGEHRHTIDAKNRIFIPAKFREELGENFVITINVREHCLRVYSQASWEAMVDGILGTLRGAERDRAIRSIARRGVQVSADAQGRVILTADQLQHAGLTKNAMIVGCHHFAEIWSEDNYNKMVNEEDLDELAAIFDAYGL